MPEDPASAEPRMQDLPVPAPFFMRLLRATKAWGDVRGDSAIRAEDAAAALFRFDDPEHSIYLIRDELDYRRVVIGLCRGRKKPTSGSFDFIPIRESELQDVGAVPTHVSEDATGCLVASRLLHYHVAAGDATLVRLCRALFADHRPYVRVSQGEVKRWMAEANAAGCGIEQQTHRPCAAVECLALAAEQS